jgi:hypothetical protein
MVENHLQRGVIVGKRTDGKNGYSPGWIGFRGGLFLHGEVSCPDLTGRFLL